ncbi:unnamed protein product [Rotaria sp. Silwood2]|nr:unnamed protein product [Rotaria sp. Silwood2]CAF3950077.1 unnamed protein product [Rotaria sp. Silwood2]CAF4024531.1 unnamed protein product [Rotaria sp. Silwood2]
MPNIAKSWCVHPCQDMVDPITGKNKCVKSGRSPTHPIGIHRIDAAMAANINKEYSLIIDNTVKIVYEGDKICTNCLRKMSKNEFIHETSETPTDEAMAVDELDWVNPDNYSNHQELSEKAWYEQGRDDIEDLPSSQENRQRREEAKRKRRFKVIQENVDLACSILYSLCDMLLETENESIKTHLSMKDAHELLFGFL